MSFKGLRDFFAGTSEAGFRQFFLLIGTAVVITALMTPFVSDLLEPKTFGPGDVAKRSIRAPRDFLLEDVASTEKRRADAAATVRPVFVRDDSEESGITYKLNEFFRTLREFAVDGTEGVEVLVLDKEARVNFERQFNVDFVGAEWEVVSRVQLWPQLRDAISGLVKPIINHGIIANKRVFQSLVEQNGGIVRSQSSGAERSLAANVEFYDLSEAAQVLKATFPNKGFGRGTAFDTVVRKLANRYLRSNVMFDTEETERRIEEARSGVEAIYYQIKKGETIVRAGDQVTPMQKRKLDQIASVSGTSNLWRGALSYVILTVFILIVVYSFTKNAWRNFRPSLRDLTVLSLTLVGSFTLVKVFSIVGRSLSLYFPDLTSDVFMLAAPVAAAGIMLQVTLSTPSVFFFVMCFALLTGVFFESSWELLLLIVLGNVVGVLSVKKWSRRSAFLRAGVRVASTNLLVVACFLLVDPQLSFANSTVRVLCAMLGGLTAGMFAAALAPVAEHFGSYLTDIKLLELSSLDHPLLRELSLQAPGTWNHSMVMGQLGEAAGEAIGANSLLTRVGAYYHDIGKSKKPGYFVENQTSKDNRHDKLTPSMSALIIRAHVKDGIEMAREHRLPEAIIDFIPQHHGTALIEFFYEKALKDAEEGEKVDENRYRYPGPRPQTKEAGILMLADSVEASSRTLSDPNPAKIQGLVQKIINKVFASGQLDECELTLKDLHQIAGAFTRVLNGIYHRRIEYSEPAEKGAVKKTGEEEAEQEQVVVEQSKDESRRAGEGGSKERSGKQSSEKTVNGASGDTLKRLGM